MQNLEGFAQGSQGMTDTLKSGELLKEGRRKHGKITQPKKVLNIKKTMVFLNNFMKKGDKILKPGDNWTVTIRTTFNITRKLVINLPELKNLLYETIKDYIKYK